MIWSRARYAMGALAVLALLALIVADYYLVKGCDADAFRTSGDLESRVASGPCSRGGLGIQVPSDVALDLSAHCLASHRLGARDRRWAAR
jgi:hypothetical protein